MQKNSFITILEQIALLNKNAVEIVTKLNDVVSAQDSNVSLTIQDTDGSILSYEMPSINFLKKEIDILNSNVKKLSGADGDNSVIIMENGFSKKIQSVDLNREPTQVSTINLVSNFEQSNNWFFESLMNPLLSVAIDLNDQITEHVRKIISRRYIVKFEKDDSNNLTTNGQESLTYFEDNFLNQNDFNITDFQTWLNSPTNLGVVNKTVDNLDEQIFELNYKEINYKGYFSVLKMERDTLNNKFWYHLNTLTYYGRDDSSNILAVGDILAITKSNSYSKYKVLEVNTASSLFRVRLERIEGYDPVPIGTSVIEFYSSLETQNTVKISIGFDEYNVLFIKPINTDNNIIGSTWSKGMAFYSNDLSLNTDNNISMVDFYLNQVYDYGTLLRDLVDKTIPTTYASKPNAPSLLTDNFKVVQINKHLTDTKDYKTLKKLHSQKNSTKAKIEQINESITEKNREINTKNFKSYAEKSKAQNELDKLIKSQQSETKLYSSYISQITNSRVDTTAEPKFRVRGFWEFPDPIIKNNSKPQEVIGFEIQYRYASKLGAENTTEGFEVTANATNLTTTKKSTGYYSKWVPQLTDIRKRSYNTSTGQWYWDIEDISDADTPNINQLDVSIQKNEKIEVRIRSISEVGYPDSKIYSDWSNYIQVEFPDNLNEVLGENEFILKEANQESVRVSFENELNAKGITKHVQDSFYVNEEYFAHTDKIIATSFKDSFGNSINLFDYLSQMTDKITSLEEAIKRAKGELKVTLFNGTKEIEITNNSTTSIVIKCEDYMNYSGTSFAYKYVENNVYMIQDFYLKFENISTDNALGLLSDKTHIGTPDSINTDYTNGNPTLINSDGKLITQSDNQYIWLLNKTNNERIYSGSTSSEAPYILAEDNKLLGSAYNNYLLLGNSPNYWYNASLTSDNIFGATIHPYVTDITTIQDLSEDGVHIVDAQDSFKYPLNIYFKPDMSTLDTLITIQTFQNPIIRKKRIKLRLDDENMSRPFIFDINFTLIRHNQYISGIRRKPELIFE